MNSSGAPTPFVLAQPRRRASVSGLHRRSRNVLVTGTVLAVLAAAGPLWVTRVGLVVAVAAAVVAVLVAWRELAEARQGFAADLLRVTRASGAALSEERRLNSAVLDTLTAGVVRSVSEAAQLRGRIAGLEVSVEKLSGTVASLGGELHRLRNEQAATQNELRRGQELIGVLQENVRSREAELEALSGPAQIRSIPRRVLSQHFEHQHPEPQPLEPGLAQPTRVTELVSEAVALPNYEGDRKLA